MVRSFLTKLHLCFIQPELLRVSPQTLSPPKPRLWLDQPVWFLQLQDALQQKPSGNFEKWALLLSPRGHSMPDGHTARPRRVTVQMHEPGALPLLGPTLGCLGFQGFTVYWLLWGLRVGIRVWEGQSKVIHAVYLGYQGFLKEEPYVKYTPYFWQLRLKIVCKTAHE